MTASKSHPVADRDATVADDSPDDSPDTTASQDERWDELVRATVRELLTTSLAEIVDEARLLRGLDAWLDGPWRAQVVGPIIDGVARSLIARTESRTETAAELLPDDAASHLVEIAAAPDLLSSTLVSELLQDPAVEAVIHDVLLDALRQFSQRINPFTADWGLPALLKLLPPVGFGRVRAGFEARRTEFEQRLEPEMRRFLAGFSRRAVGQVAELVIRKQKEPEFVAFRQRMLSALLRRPLAELVWPSTDPKTAHLVEAVRITVEGQAVGKLLRSEAGSWLERWVAQHRDATVGEVLEAWGVRLPDVAPQLRPFYPLLAWLLSRPAVRAAIDPSAPSSER